MLPETPKFWQARGFCAYALLPFSWVYNAVHCLKYFLAKPYASSLPVICLGGVVAGGSGKTPIVHALLELARNDMQFINPIILTRGYGGEMKGPSLVDLSQHTFMDVGDEALLHAMRAPTIVSRNRAAGVRLAEAMGADLVIMDDGLQNNSISKTISFAVVDAAYKFGNGFTLPAGPLREPVYCALKKCDAVILSNGVTDVSHKTVFETSLQILSDNDKTKSYFAFAGLGHPEKFRKTLVENGFNVTGFKTFPDHHPYMPEDMEELLDQSGSNILITTEKDLTRIPAAYRVHVDVLKIGYEFARPHLVCNLIRAKLGR